MAKDKVNVNIPKIKKLEPSIQVEKNLYDTEKFTKVVSNYLKNLIILMTILNKRSNNYIK